MSNHRKIVQPTVRRRPARKRGPLSSEEYNNFQDQVVNDIYNISSASNANHSTILHVLSELYSENTSLRRRVESLEKAQDYSEFSNGKSSVRITKYIDFHNSIGFIVPTNIKDTKISEMNSQFGELYLPSAAIENKFYSLSIRDNEIVMPYEFSSDVTSTFDKLGGDGLVNYEQGGKANPGMPQYAFNGINEKTWVRSVEFPLESNVDQVEVQITIRVPNGVSAQANLLEIMPFPEGEIDITEISTSPDLTSSFVIIDNFVEANNIGNMRFHFSPRNVDQLRLRLRSRNWREMNGKKVFSYGLRTVNLKLVDYVKEFQSADLYGQNVTAIVEIKPPTNHRFGSLFRVDPRPNFLLEDADLRHIRLRITKELNLNNVLWDSSLDIPPQSGISIGVDLESASKLYAMYTFKYVSSSGGYNSPFSVGTTPYTKGLGLVFSAIPTNSNQ